jgi:hypothetical protein
MARGEIMSKAGHRRTLRDEWRSLKHIVNRRRGRFAVPVRPHFEMPETTRWFVDALQRADSYLEFGAGGSTYLAAAAGKQFVSVESDRYFLDKLRGRIEADGLFDPDFQEYRNADIGLTREWGYPVRPPTMMPRGRLAAYSAFPADAFAGSFCPELVLVDGRFRVACALKALRALAGRSGWTLLFDDYAARGRYHVVEEFGELVGMVGRMAIFRGVRRRQPADWAAAIAAHETDPE